MRRILDLVAALNEADVNYVVVGGVAVVLRGHARMTVDLDLALDLSTDNVLAALEVLREYGLVPRLPVAPEDFADERIRGQWVEHRNLIAFTMYDPANALREVDLLATTAIPFGALLARSDVIDVAGVPVRLASVEDLVAMKRTAARAQDLADIEALLTLTDPTTVGPNEQNDI